MTDPFAPLGRRERQDDYDPDTGPGYISVPCQVCKSPCVRRQYPPYNWEHEDDEVVMKGTRLISSSRYDHRAEPDYIDVDVLE